MPRGTGFVSSCELELVQGIPESGDVFSCQCLVVDQTKKNMGIGLFFSLKTNGASCCCLRSRSGQVGVSLWPCHDKCHHPLWHCPVPFGEKKYCFAGPVLLARVCSKGNQCMVFVLLLFDAILK